MSLSPPLASEDEIHKAILALVHRVVPTAFPFHPSNTGKRSFGAMNRLKKLGQKPGVPDIVVLLPGKRFALIEVKAAAGRLNEDQENFRAWAIAAGADYAVCRSVSDGEMALRQWGLM